MMVIDLPLVINGSAGWTNSSMPLTSVLKVRSNCTSVIVPSGPWSPIAALATTASTRPCLFFTSSNSPSISTQTSLSPLDISKLPVMPGSCLTLRYLRRGSGSIQAGAAKPRRCAQCRRSSMDDVVKTTIFYANVEDFGRLNEVTRGTCPIHRRRGLRRRTCGYRMAYWSRSEAIAVLGGVST
jgi:hypothetical protein